jgi:hypothetical protein
LGRAPLARKGKQLSFARVVAKVSAELLDGLLNSLAAFFNVFERGRVGETDVFLLTKIFSGDHGDLRCFEEIIGDVARRIEFFAVRRFAE